MVQVSGPRIGLLSLRETDLSVVFSSHTAKFVGAGSSVAAAVVVSAKRKLLPAEVSLPPPVLPPSQVAVDAGKPKASNTAVLSLQRGIEATPLAAGSIWALLG